MDELVNQFLEIRQFIMSRVEEMIEVYFTNIWDPMMKYVIIKETQQLLKNEVGRLFPDFPSILFPKIKIKIFEEENEIEIGIQQFLNKEKDLIFLGNVNVGENNYDLYCRKSFDPRFDYVFFARYGHTQECTFKGAKSAASDYILGKQTPLSVAFELAIEEGFVS